METWNSTKTQHFVKRRAEKFVAEWMTGGTDLTLAVDTLLRDMLGKVLKDSAVFAASLSENISNLVCSRPSTATREELETAIGLAVCGLMVLSGDGTKDVLEKYDYLLALAEKIMGSR